MSLRPTEATDRAAERIANELNIDSVTVSTADAVNAVLYRVFSDTEVTNEFNNGAIQLQTVRAIIAREVLRRLNYNPEAIGIMVIGDIELPEFMVPVLEEIWNARAENDNNFKQKYGAGYDLDAQGMPEARESLMDYLDQFYGFSKSSIPDLKEKFKKNSTLLGGGMQAIQMVTGALNYGIVQERQKGGKRHTRFNHADNTFAMAKEIADRTLVDEPSERLEIPTAQKNLLHLTPDDIDAFYAEKGSEEVQDIWYMIPVGNPSGTEDSAENLQQTCKAVLKHNPGAVFMLDLAYVRTMGPERAQRQMGLIMNDSAILNRAVFVDSFSKSHGLCGYRLGTYFSYNEDLYRQILSYDRTIGQGHGLDKSALIKAICDTNSEREAKIQQLRQFWGRERFGLYTYLMRDEFSDLFDDDQSHLVDEQLNNPENSTSIYLTLKTKEGITDAQVAARTGCMGMPCVLKSGRYIRFSVGTITKPTYQKHINEVRAVA